MRNENDDPIAGRQDDDAALNAANRQAEAMFATFAPALGGVDPVAAGFAAGQRAAWQSQRRQLWTWRAAAAVAFVGAGLSWVIPMASPGQNNLVRDESLPPSPSGTVVVVHAPSTSPDSPPTATTTLPPQSVLVMRHAVSEAGLTGLPVPSLPISDSVRNAPLF